MIHINQEVAGNAWLQLNDSLQTLGSLIDAFVVMMVITAIAGIGIQLWHSLVVEERRRKLWDSIAKHDSNKQEDIMSNNTQDRKPIFMVSYIAGIITLNSDRIAEAGVSDAERIGRFRKFCATSWNKVTSWCSRQYDQAKNLVIEGVAIVLAGMVSAVVALDEIRLKIVDGYRGIKSWIYNSVYLPMSNWNQTRLHNKQDNIEDEFFAEGDSWSSDFNWIQRLLGMDKLIQRCESIEQRLVEQTEIIANQRDEIAELRKNQFDPTEWNFVEVSSEQETELIEPVIEVEVEEVEDVPELTPEQIAEDNVLPGLFAPPAIQKFEAMETVTHSRNLRLKVDAAADRLLARREEILETLKNVDGTIQATDYLERLRNMVREDEDLSEVLGMVDIYNAKTIHARIRKAVGV